MGAIQERQVESDVFLLPNFCCSFQVSFGSCDLTSERFDARRCLFDIGGRLRDRLVERLFLLSGGRQDVLDIRRRIVTPLEELLAG